MKKLLIFSVIILFVIGCSKKVTPAKTETTTSGDTKSNNEVTAVVTAPPETPMNPTAEELAAGKITYTAKCGKCHDLPVTTEYTAKRWVGLVSWMAPKAKLGEDERKNVLAYVMANAKKS